LLALGALLAPILLHLVRRPRRVVRIGNLQLQQGVHRRVRSLRWHDGLLLALRCALLTALVLSLAGLRWQPRAAAPARWLLVVPGTDFDATARDEWARLRQEGYELRSLSPGFPAIAMPAATVPAAVDAWSLLRELDLRLPAGSRAAVFGPTHATLFRGSRPTLANVDMRWHATAGEPSPLASTQAPRVGLVAAADREEDARFLRAAFAVIGAMVVADDSAEWIFQLGDVELPAGWRERVKGGARLVTDAPNAERPVNVTRWFDVGANRVRLIQRVAIDAGTPVLRDSAGEPLFTEERHGTGSHWRFAMRFHPDWTDWPIESAFPAWWRDQLAPVTNTALQLAPEQAAPGFAPANATATPTLAGFGSVDLRGGSWWLAVMLFVVERILSANAQRRRLHA
jgi:hypothetical protein